MKLIKRKTLHYQKDSSDKVYEVDLYEVAEDKYLVNFRYGRRGANLKEGTKTTQPVALTKAQQVFDKLVGEKTKKGYVDVSAVSSVTPAAQSVATGDDGTKQAILNRLADNQPSSWKLERAIWRAGELKLREATPLLINLLGTGDDLRDYCIVWALGWCGDKSAIAVLTELYENSETPEFVSRIAFEALLKLADERLKATLQAGLVASLPLELGRLARTSSPELFENFAVNYPYYFFAVFEKLYQVDNPYIRASILKILRRAPFQPNYFRSIRRIFKIAEYRCDAEVFGILAYRFERVAGNFNNDLLTFSWHDEEEKKYQLDNRRVYDDELKKSQPIVAYSYQTQQYLRRRVWRSLKRLGETGDPNYITMAVAILLEYSDDREPVVVRSQFSKWDNYTRDIKQYWDRYTDYLTFNHILYSNSAFTVQDKPMLIYVYL